MTEPWTIARAAREKPPLLHPLGGASFATFREHLLANRPFDRRSRLLRAVAAASLLARFPFTQYEKLRWGRAVASHELREAPIFIIGHWRSGTTYLHNLLAQDRRFAWITLGQTMMPWNMLGKKTIIARKLIQMILPETRGMDNVAFSFDSPQEEEIALANMNLLSHGNCYYFPRNLRRHFNQSILFEDVSPRQIEEFAGAYRTLAQKLSYLNGSRRLLFKNPCSTGRMLFLKEIFPGARFIFIVRNPFHVFASTLAHYGRIMNAFAWQKFDDLDYESITLENYRLLMRRFLEDRKQLEPGDLFEVSYEEVTASPLEKISEIYHALSIREKEPALQSIGNYLDSIKDYRRNPHQLTRSQVERIRSEWSFALEHWGYDLPEDLPLTD